MTTRSGGITDSLSSRRTRSDSNSAAVRKPCSRSRRLSAFGITSSGHINAPATSSVATTYLNGRAKTTTTGSFDGSATTGHTCIGRRTYAANLNYFNGQIDAPMIWNRLLSAGEVAQLYEQQWQIMQPPLAWQPAVLQGPIGGSSYSGGFSTFRPYAVPLTIADFSARFD